MESLELDESVLEGLRLLNGDIDEEATRKLIINSVKQLLIKGSALPSRPEIYSSDASSNVKKAEFAVCAVLVLGAQHSTDPIELRQLLDNYKINNQTAEQLIEAYEKFKDEITLKLARIGNSHCIPDLTNVSVEVQQVSANELIYKVNFHTFNHSEGKTRIMQEVFCNQEELQSLINKFKDIERHCKNLSK